MARNGVSLKDAGWGPDGPSGSRGPTHRRRKLPTGRAVLWSPRGSSGSEFDRRPEGSGPYEFFIQRSVIVGINDHVSGTDQEPHFGFLLGHPCRCPATGVHYSVADTAIAADEVLIEEAAGACLIRAWAEARSVFADHSGVLLGWYHSHQLLGLMLSGSDEDANERYFGQPWQASIVVVPNPKRPLGGIFRLYPDAEAAERRRPSKFYELLDRPTGAADSGGAADSRVASAVIWTNYEIDRREPAVVPEIPAEVFKPRPDGADGADGRDGPDESLPFRLVMPGEGPQGDLLPAMPKRRLSPLLLGVFVLVMVIVVLLIVANGPDPAPVTTLPQARTVRTLLQRQFFESVDGLDIASERYDQRAADFEIGRINCDLLATGYAAADASFVRIAASFGPLGAEPGREARDAYEAASGKIAVINTHFDGSGCPRP